jgi:MATE family multidrug resistance protein
MVCMGASFLLFPDFYLSWFKNEQNPELWAHTSAMAIVILRIIAIFTVLDSVYLNVSFALKGAGDTRFVSVIALVMPWPIMVLPAFLLRDQIQAFLYAWSFAALYAFCVAGVLIWRFRGGKWKSMSVIHPPPA